MNDDIEDLVELDQADFRGKYAQIANEMVTERTWYKLDGLYKGMPSLCLANVRFQKIDGAKNLALGRSTYYDRFMDDLRKTDNIEIYQSDYLMWIAPDNPYESLLFFIDTADVIHFNIEGIAIDDIAMALRTGKRSRDRDELETRFMTIWEMNQVIYSSSLARTIWHVNGELDNVDVNSLFERHSGLFEIKWGKEHKKRFVLTPRGSNRYE